MLEQAGFTKLEFDIILIIGYVVIDCLVPARPTPSRSRLGNIRFPLSTSCFGTRCPHNRTRPYNKTHPYNSRSSRRLNSLDPNR